jgi:alkylation response protein AidB-like acyl-CoA dehydrogenase
MTTTDSSRASGRIPDLRYQEAENDLRSAVRDLFDDRSPWPSVLARTESDEPNDAALWHSLAAELGCAGLLIPESQGGAGATYREAAVVAEETGRAVAPVPYLGSAVVATAALLGGGDELLPGLAEGRLTAALAVEFARMPPGSEPGARGPGLATGVRMGAAQPGDPPGQARLTGTVTGVADALLADVLLVPADGVPFGLYAVDAGAPGVSRAAVVSLDATRPLCNLALDSAPARPVATGEAAAQAVASALAAGAAMLASEQLGVAERCLEMTVAYLKERRQFGRPVADFQGVQFMLADAAMKLEAARQLAYAAAAKSERAMAGEKVADLTFFSSACKCFASDVAMDVTTDAVQLLGGYGYVKDFPVERMMRDAKITQIYEGTNQIQRVVMARQLLK